MVEILAILTANTDASDIRPILKLSLRPVPNHHRHRHQHNYFFSSCSSPAPAPAPAPALLLLLLLLLLLPYTIYCIYDILHTIAVAIATTSTIAAGTATNEEKTM